MERKKNAKHHDKHKHVKHHRALDAFELYEIEHMPRTLVKAPSDHHAKPYAPEAISPDYNETGRNGTHYWRPKEDEGGAAGNMHNKENIDVEAETFIM
ncbi:hypothetical protein CASFOL_006205 [Castilleja foliolosa]|uniref:Uncharacterized protein n=1 Tax=Castilleja foliolosa TaxID=1961234 RepID=A0ABD3E6L7_9LAMI